MKTSVVTHPSDNIERLTDLLERSTAIQKEHHKESLLSFSPESLEALYTLAYDFYNSGQYQQAKDCFRLLTLADSLKRRYWMGLGACCQLLKQYHEAIDCYSAAALQDPSDPQVHRYAADCFFHLGKIPEAQEALNGALAAAKANPLYRTLIPQLTLLADTWSCLSNGVPNG